MAFWSHTVDATDGYANQGKELIFQSVPNPDAAHTVRFKAFLTDYSESFKTKWNTTEVYGRNDAIQTFQGTQRTISVGFSIPAADVAEAYSNLDKCSLLMRMLYPTYESDQGATSIAKAPLLRLKFLNLISKGDAGGEIYTGLLGTVDGFEYSPDIEAGFVDWSSNNQLGSIAPKVIKISFTFTVLHEENLGWDMEGNWRGDGGVEGGSYFPWMDQRTSSTSTEAPSDSEASTASEEPALPEVDGTVGPWDPDYAADASPWYGPFT